MRRIGIIDVDSTGFPNLALMKSRLSPLFTDVVGVTMLNKDYEEAAV